MIQNMIHSVQEYLENQQISHQMMNNHMADYIPCR